MGTTLAGRWLVAATRMPWTMIRRLFGRAKGNGGIGIIIDAFNSDKPYEHFLKQQLAGDARWSIGVMPKRRDPENPCSL